jgi:hypothetical protein
VRFCAVTITSSKVAAAAGVSACAGDRHANIAAASGNAVARRGMRASTTFDCVPPGARRSFLSLLRVIFHPFSILYIQTIFFIFNSAESTRSR